MIAPRQFDYLSMSTSDAPRLLVLKSMYNRFAVRLNRDSVRQWRREQEELLVQLKYLKEQIEQYE